MTELATKDLLGNWSSQVLRVVERFLSGLEVRESFEGGSLVLLSISEFDLSFKYSLTLVKGKSALETYNYYFDILLHSNSFDSIGALF